MNRVLAQMVKVEGFTEIVETMRGLLSSHRKVKDETKRKYEAVLKDIFGPGNAPKDDENK